MTIFGKLQRHLIVGSRNEQLPLSHRQGAPTPLEPTSRVQPDAGYPVVMIMRASSPTVVGSDLGNVRVSCHRLQFGTAAAWQPYAGRDRAAVDHSTQRLRSTHTTTRVPISLDRLRFSGLRPFGRPTPPGCDDILMTCDNDDCQNAGWAARTDTRSECHRSTGLAPVGEVTAQALGPFRRRHRTDQQRLPPGFSSCEAVESAQEIPHAAPAAAATPTPPGVDWHILPN